MLLKSGHPNEAHEAAGRAVGIFRRSQDQDSKPLASSEAVLGACLVALRRFAEAEPLLLRSHGVYTTNYRHDPDVRGILGDLVSLYDAWGKPEKAAQYRAILKETKPPESTAAVDR